jgi:hypothetical protein
MTEHPITPPPELVEKVSLEAMAAFPNDECGAVEVDEARDEYIANFFTQWGADQELEACCDWAQGYAECGDSLRAARRPKPQSLKQQALCALIDGIARGGNDPSDIDTIRRALDLLPD